MNKTIIALAAIVMTAGVASAQDNRQAEVNTMRDTAPASIVVKQPSNVDSSNSALGAPTGATYQQEREQLIQSRADNH